VAQVHPKGGVESVCPAAGIAKDGHVGQAHMHGQVAEPGEEGDVPEAKSLGAGLGRLQPDPRLGDLPEVVQAMHVAQTRKSRYRAGDENEEHPRRADSGELAEFLEPRDSHNGRHRADNQNNHDPSHTIGAHIGQRGMPDMHAESRETKDHRRGGHADHGRRQAAVEDAADKVVDHRQARSDDLTSVPVKRQPGADRNGSADERPAQHREQVTQEQPEDQVPSTGSPLDEQGPDDELGRGDVLTGKQPGEVSPVVQPVRRDRRPLEFVESVQTAGKAGCLVAGTHACLLLNRCRGPSWVSQHAPTTGQCTTTGAPGRCPREAQAE